MSQPVRKAGSTEASCDHPKYPSWKSKSVSGRVCPCCDINDHITEVKEIHSGLERRDGVFASKQQYRYDAQFMSHKDWMQRWQRARILCTGAVESLNKLNKENPAHAEEWGIKQALSIWESAADECGKVPGYSYVLEKPKDFAQEADKGETMRRCDSHEEKVLSAQELRELWADDREYVVKPRRKSHKSQYTGSTTPRVPKFSFSRTDGKTFNLKSQSPHRTEIQAVDMDDGVLKEMEDVTNRLQDRLDTGSYESSNAVEDTGIEMIQIVESGNPSTSLLTASPIPKAIEDSNLHQALSSTSPNVQPREPPTTQAKSTSRSALKGTRSSTSSSLQPTTLHYPRSTKLNFSGYATVIPGQDASSLPEKAVQQPHNKYTDAQTSRLRKLYQRSSPFYNASTAHWSSPKGYEKVETSFNYKTWDYLDTANKLEGRNPSSIEPETKLHGVMANKAATSNFDPAPSDPDFTAAIKPLEDDLAEAMLNEDKAVAQNENDTANEVPPEQCMPLILHPTASTNIATRRPSCQTACPLNTVTNPNKQLIRRPKPGELSIIHKAPAFTSSRAPVRRIKRSFAPPKPHAPKSRPSTESAFTLRATAVLGSGHCMEGGEIRCGLMFGVAERESER